MPVQPMASAHPGPPPGEPPLRACVWSSRASSGLTANAPALRALWGPLEGTGGGSPSSPGWRPGVYRLRIPVGRPGSRLPGLSPTTSGLNRFKVKRHYPQAPGLHHPPWCCASVPRAGGLSGLGACSSAETSGTPAAQRVTELGCRDLTVGRNSHGVVDLFQSWSVPTPRQPALPHTVPLSRRAAISEAGCCLMMTLTFIVPAPRGRTGATRGLASRPTHPSGPPWWPARAHA